MNMKIMNQNKISGDSNLNIKIMLFKIWRHRHDDVDHHHRHHNHLEKKLVLGEPLHRLEQVGR